MLRLRGALKAVFFDAGGTLIAPRPSIAEIYNTVLGGLGVRATGGDLRQAAVDTWAEFDGLVGKGRDRYSHFPGGELEYWRRFVRRVLERVSEPEWADKAAAALHEAFSDPGSWTVFPDVRPTLDTLREHKLRLGVISNWDSRLRGLLESFGLASQFEAIIVSCEVGAEKPSAAIFERALDSLGIASHEALHVGDDLISDYEGPRAAGMEAAFLSRQGAVPPGVRTIHGLDGLITLLTLSER